MRSGGQLEMVSRPEQPKALTHRRLHLTCLYCSYDEAGHCKMQRPNDPPRAIAKPRVLRWDLPSEACAAIQAARNKLTFAVRSHTPGGAPMLELAVMSHAHVHTHRMPVSSD